MVRLASGRRAGLLLAAGGAVAAAAAGLGAWRRSELERAGIRLEMRTATGPALILDLVGEDGEKVRMLVVNGTIESATYLDDLRYDLVFDYLRAFDVMYEAGRPVSHALMLGGGGYSYPKHIVSHHPETSIDVVEVDPAMTRIARKHFFLGDLEREYDCTATGRLRTYCDDGRAFLEGDAGRPRYDAILNDSFSGNDPAASLMTVEAARAMRDRLAEGGLYLMNVVTSPEGTGALLLQAVERTLGEVFSHVHVIPCDPESPSASDNVIVVATDATCDLPGETTVPVASGAPVITDDNVGNLAHALFR
ncbi:MAG: spermidine synthase [Olsenella sp.]